MSDPIMELVPTWANSKPITEDVPTWENSKPIPDKPIPTELGVNSASQPMNSAPKLDPGLNTVLPKDTNFNNAPSVKPSAWSQGFGSGMSAEGSDFGNQAVQATDKIPAETENSLLGLIKGITPGNYAYSPYGVPQKVDPAGLEPMQADVDKSLKDNSSYVNQGSGVGGFMGAMAPSMAMFAVSGVTGNPVLANAALAGIGIGGFSSGIEADKAYRKSQGLPENNQEALLAGIGYAAAYTLPTTKYLEGMGIGMKNLFGNGLQASLEANPEATAAFSKEVFENFLKVDPNSAQQLLTGLGKAAVGGALTMGTATLAQDAIDKYVIGQGKTPEQFWGGLGQSMLSGGLMGGMLYPFAKIGQNSQTQARQEAQGGVTVTQDAKGPIEIIPTTDSDGNPINVGQRPDGSSVDLTQDQINNAFTVPTDVFNQAKQQYAQTGSVADDIARQAYEGRITNYASKLMDNKGFMYSSTDKYGNNLWINGNDKEGNVIVTNPADGSTFAVKPDDLVTPVEKIHATEFTKAYMNQYDQTQEAQNTPRAADISQLQQHTASEVDRLQHENGNMESVTDNQGKEWNIKSGDVNDPNAMLMALDPNNPDPNQTPTILNKSNLDMETYQVTPSPQYAQNVTDQAHAQWDAQQAVDKVVQDQEDAKLKVGDTVTSKRKQGATGRIASIDHGKIFVEYPDAAGEYSETSPIQEMFTANQTKDITKIQPNTANNGQPDTNTTQNVPDKGNAVPVGQAAQQPVKTGSIDLGSGKKPDVAGIVTHPDGTKRLDKVFTDKDSAIKALDVVKSKLKKPDDYSFKVETEDISKPEDEFKNDVYRVAFTPKESSPSTGKIQNLSAGDIGNKPLVNNDQLNSNQQLNTKQDETASKTNENASNADNEGSSKVKTSPTDAGNEGSAKTTADAAGNGTKKPNTTADNATADANGPATGETATVPGKEKEVKPVSNGQAEGKASPVSPGYQSEGKQGPIAGDQGTQGEGSGSQITVPDLTPDQVISAHNNLVSKIEEHNSLPNNHTNRKREVYSQVQRYAQRLGYAIKPMPNGNIEVQKDGQKIRRIAIKTSKEDIEAHKSLEDYEPPVKDFINKMLDTPNAMTGLEINADTNQGVRNIREGKKTVAHNEVLDALEGMHKDGVVKFRATKDTPRAEVPIKDYFSIFDHPLTSQEQHNMEDAPDEANGNLHTATHYFGLSPLQQEEVDNLHIENGQPSQINPGTKESDLVKGETVEGTGKTQEEVRKTPEVTVYQKQIDELTTQRTKLATAIKTKTKAFDNRNGIFGDQNAEPNDMFGGAGFDASAGGKVIKDLSDQVKVIDTKIEELKKLDATGKKEGQGQAELHIPNLDQEIAAQNPDLNPTEAQKQSGNYKKAHIVVQGMPITIENPKGSIRSGTDNDGNDWSNEIKSHYGYFKETEGKDGDHIDTFIGNNPESQKVFVVDQGNPKNGAFDESKVMLGFNTLEEAKQGYLENYAKGWDGLQDITESSVDDFKKWLNDGQKQSKPYSDYSQIKNQNNDNKEKASEGDKANEEGLLKPKDEAGKPGESPSAKPIDTIINPDKKFIGVNEDNNNVYEDKNGNRFYTTNGVKVSAPVSISPHGSSISSPEQLYRGGRHSMLTKNEVKAFSENNKEKNFTLKDGREFYDAVAEEILKDADRISNVRNSDEQNGKIALEHYFSGKDYSKVLHDFVNGSNVNAVNSANHFKKELLPQVIDDLYKRIMNSKGEKPINPLDFITPHGWRGHLMKSRVYAKSIMTPEELDQARAEGMDWADQKSIEKSIDEKLGNIKKETTPEYSNGKLVKKADTPFGTEYQVKYKTPYGFSTKNFYSYDPNLSFPTSFNNEAEIDAFKKSLEDNQDQEEPKQDQHKDPNWEFGGEKQQEKKDQENGSYGKDNKFITGDRYEELKRKMREKGNNLNSGFDPELFTMGAEMAAYHIEAGARKFADFAKKMIGDVGEWVKPYLASFYEGARRFPEMKEYRKDLDSSDFVDNFDIDKFNPNEYAKQDDSGQQQLPDQVRKPSDVNPKGPVPGPIQGAKDEGSANGVLPGEGESGNKNDGLHPRPGSDVAGSRGGSNSGSSKPKPRQKTLNNNNYTIPVDYVDPKSFSAVQTFDNNLNAVEVLSNIIAGNRSATPEEQQALAKYAGWGGLSDVLYKPGTYQFRNLSYPQQQRVQKLYDLVGKIDPDGKIGVYDAIKESTLSAFFTPVGVIRGNFDILGKAGFTGGTFLEPSLGIGQYFGAMPKGMRQNTTLHGVELDYLTGKIAKALYPDANIQITGLQEAGFSNNYFDVAMSNIPFGDMKVYDPTWKTNSKPIYKLAQSRIHNYFAVKMIELTKPGGMTILISSNALLDTKGNEAIRRYIGDNAEFLGAIRLPNNTFKGNANTEVTTDIIVLRKFKEGEQKDQQRNFIESKQANLPHETNGSNYDVSYNEYFHDNPKMMLGTPMTGGQYRGDTFTLKGNPDDNLQTAIKSRIKDIIPKDKIVIDTTVSKEETNERLVKEYQGIDKSFVREGNIVLQDGKLGKITITRNQYGEPDIKFVEQKINAPQSRVVDLIRLRNSINELMFNELNGESDEALLPLRRKLNTEYDNYTKAHGKLRDPDNKFIQDDIDRYTLKALEKYDSKGKYIGKADIFNKRTINPIKRVESVDSPEQAILVSLDEYGSIVPARMVQLLGEDWQKQIKDQVYELPDNPGAFSTRDEYLSGNVKKKLQQAILAAKTNPAFEHNVKALESVIPADISPSGITINLGARWVPDTDYTNFSRKLLGIRRGDDRGGKVTYLEGSDSFVIEKPMYSTPEMERIYGTPRKSGIELLDAALNDKAVKVIDTDRDGRSHLNVQATQAAEEKILNIKQVFDKWLFEDQDRSKRLSAMYNEKFNTSVKMKSDGGHLTFPGLQGVVLRQHQKDADWMIMQNKGGVIDHIVGAGKTLVMITSAMEMRRTGIAKKPMILALKATVPQMAEAFRSYYPFAKVLAPNENEFSAAKRKSVLAQIATNDWDSVILSHDQYVMLNHDFEMQAATMQEEMDALDASIEYLYGVDNPSQMTKRQLKGLEKRKTNLMVKLQNLNDRKTDDEFTFEKLGVDHLFVDESHEFKNLAYSTSHSNIAGLGSPEGAQKTQALLMGIRYLQKLHQGDKGTTFLSGTPISNSMVELFNILKYLRPNKMAELGIGTFDGWASTFSERSSEVEFTVTGQLKQKDRFRRFSNVPELSKLYAEIADVRNDKNLTLPKPKGVTQLIHITPSATQADLTNRIIEFAKTGNGDALGKTLTDNQKKAKMLLATTLSAKVAIDVRLYDELLGDEESSKIHQSAIKINEIYHQFNDVKGVQLVFSDLGVPSDKFNVYDELRRKLTEDFNIPKSEIQFIHDYDTQDKKDKLFKRVNDGEVRIVLGSTSKLGTGVNVQQRITAIHHLDIPWNPAKYEQRNGRGVRQGNEIALSHNNNEVNIFIYALERSLDAYKFQLLEIKQRLINQVKDGSIAERTIDEGGSDEEGAGFAEFVALLSGNPIILDKAKIDKKVHSLYSSRRIFQEEQWKMKSDIELNEEKAEKLKLLIDQNKDDVDHIAKNGFVPDDNGKYPYSINIEVKNSAGTSITPFDKPKEAGIFLLSQVAIQGNKVTVKGYGAEGYIKPAESTSLDGQRSIIHDMYMIQLSGLPSNIPYMKPLSSDATYAGMEFTELLKRVISNGKVYENALVGSQQIIEKYKPLLGQTWEKQPELDAAVTEQTRLRIALENIESQQVQPKENSEVSTDNETEEDSGMASVRNDIPEGGTEQHIKEAQPVLDDINDASKSKDNVVFKSGEQILKDLEKSGRPVSPELEHSLLHDDWAGYTIDGNIYLKPKLAPYRNKISQVVMHEKVHTFFKNYFFNDKVKSNNFEYLYDSLGADEINRFLPEYYRNQSPANQGEEYVAHVVDSIVRRMERNLNESAEESLDFVLSKIPNENVKSFILAALNNIIDLNKLQHVVNTYSKRSATNPGEQPIGKGQEGSIIKPESGPPLDEGPKGEIRPGSDGMGQQPSPEAKPKISNLRPDPDDFDTKQEYENAFEKWVGGNKFPAFRKYPVPEPIKSDYEGVLSEYWSDLARWKQGKTVWNKQEDPLKYFPGYTEASGSVKDLYNAIRTTFVPTSVDTGARLTGAALSQRASEMQRNLDMAEAAEKRAVKFFDKNTVDENLNFIDRWETGQPQPNAELQGYQDAMQAIKNQLVEEVRQLGTGKLETLVENHFSHRYKDAKGADQFLLSRSKRPFGPQGWSKQRTIPTLREAINERGLEPLTYNPIRLELGVIREMERYIMAHKVLNELIENGNVDFVSIGEHQKEGFFPLDDSISKVYQTRKNGEKYEIGKYFATEGTARLINNFLSKGLSQHKWFRIYKGLSNLFTSFQLGISAFHAGFITMDTTISKLAIGLDYAYHGEMLEAAKHIGIAATPGAAMVDAIIKGNKMMKAWYGNPSTPQLAVLAEQLAIAGGQAKMDKYYATGFRDQIKDCLLEHRYGSLIYMLPVRAVELAAWPIMEWLVPRAKLGVFYDMSQYTMKTHPDATPEELRDMLQSSQRNVENRLGQLKYDNLHWNKVTKDLLMGSVRALGWALGSFREAFGAPGELFDIANQGIRGKRAINTKKIFYFLSLIGVTMTYASIYQYLMTGTWPEELKDYFFPKNGQFDKNGIAKRSTLPTYTKDYYSYGSHPGSTIVNKLNPLLGIIAQLTKDKDYFGTRIYEKNDPFYKIGWDALKYTGSQAIPFGLRNVFIKDKDETGYGKYLNLIGITDAPYNLNMTKAEELSYDIRADKLPIGGRSPEEKDQSDLKRKLRDEYLKTGSSEEVDQAKADGLISKAEYTKIIKSKENGEKPSIINAVTGLSNEDVLRVYQVGNTKEKDALREYLDAKLDKKLDTDISDKQRTRIEEMKILIKPIQ